MVSPQLRLPSATDAADLFGLPNVSSFIIANPPTIDDKEVSDCRRLF